MKTSFFSFFSFFFFVFSLFFSWRKSRFFTFSFFKKTSPTLTGTNTRKKLFFRSLVPIKANKDFSGLTFRIYRIVCSIVTPPPPLCPDFSVEKGGNSMTSHDMAKPILLKSFYFRQFPFISKKSPVKSRDDHLFPPFFQKTARKTPHVMGSHGITPLFH